MSINVHKIVIVGDSAVGKTSLVRRYRTNEFRDEYERTMGVEVHPISFTNSNGDQYTLNVWDLDGDESQNLYFEQYVAGAVAAMVVFDVTRPETYSNVPRLIKKLRQAGIDNYILCGNKADRPDRVVYYNSSADRERYNETYIDTSALDHNAINPFVYILRTIG